MEFDEVFGEEGGQRELELGWVDGLEAVVRWVFVIFFFKL